MGPGVPFLNSYFATLRYIMSAELIRSWLNDDVGLSRQVGSFEDDLANGYLIGELLHRHALVTDSAFGGFKDQQAGVAPLLPPHLAARCCLSAC